MAVLFCFVIYDCDGLTSHYLQFTNNLNGQQPNKQNNTKILYYHAWNIEWRLDDSYFNDNCLIFIHRPIAINYVIHDPLENFGSNRLFITIEKDQMIHISS
jgi:hypothetical protein